MSSAELVLRLLQSALSIYAALYLISPFGLPGFYLRHLSLEAMHDRRVSLWRLWPQGILTVLAIGVLVYSAAYAIIAAIPYDWGSHDEDGEWQATRDTIRFILTAVGALSLTFAMEKVARAVALETFIRAIVRHRTPDEEIVRAMSRLHRDLRRDHYMHGHWSTPTEQEFTASLLKAFDDTVTAYATRGANEPS
jgi:hypothetical protein